MLFQYANRAKTQLARSITTSDTVINIISGDGALFPAIRQGEEAFPITIVSIADQTQFEICYVIARNADTFTLRRAQENTKAMKFESGDIVSLNMSAKIFDLFPQAGFLGIYDNNIAKMIGGYKKNAVLADPQTPTQLWISLQDNNKTPPDIEATEWWSSVNFDAFGEKFTEFVSGRIGLRPNDIQGISLLTNGDTGRARYKDNRGNSWDIAAQEDVDGVNSDLQSLKADVVRGHGFSSGDKRITDIWGNNNERTRLEANLEGGTAIISARLEDIQDEYNRAVRAENNINNDLQNFKSQEAVTSEAYSDYDTRITHARIMHDQPHPHVAIQGSDGKYDHTLANLDDINDTNTALNNFKQDAVTGHGYSNGDNRITNIWANNNSDRQRLQANVPGKNDIIAASINDVWDERDRAIQDVTNERNRAQNVETSLISGRLGLNSGDKAGRGLHTNSRTGRANYWDENGNRGDFPWASEFDAFVNRFQLWTAKVSNGDWVYFPRSIDGFLNENNVCNVSIFMGVINSTYNSVWNRDNNIFLCNVSRDGSGRQEIEHDKFRVTLQHYWTGKNDAKGGTAGNTWIQFLAIKTS